MSEVVNFISIVGFPAFVAYYVLSKYFEERQRNNDFKDVLKKIEQIVEKWNYTISTQSMTLNNLVTKIDKLIEYDTIIIERISNQRRSYDEHQ